MGVISNDSYLKTAQHCCILSQTIFKTKLFMCTLKLLITSFVRYLNIWSSFSAFQFFILFLKKCQISYRKITVDSSQMIQYNI